ncbi:MAG: S8 family serine peptidase [Candidatus Sumerlaeia bacterium]|nr:S8 family serine peptidase [Candidatus Sumerlaeia bacterium]
MNIRALITVCGALAVLGGCGRLAPAPPRVISFAEDFLPPGTLHLWNGDTLVPLLPALDEVRVLAREPEGQATAPQRAMTMRLGSTGESLLGRPVETLSDLAEAAGRIVRAPGSLAATVYDLSAPVQTPGQGQPLPRQFSLRLAPGVSLEQVCQEHRLRVVQGVAFAPGVHIVEAVSPELTAGLDAANALYESGQALFATPLLPLAAGTQASFNDPIFVDGYQWNLHNTGGRTPPWSPGAVAGNDLNVLPVYDMTDVLGRPINGTGINIAVVDVGVRMDQADIRGRIEPDPADPANPNGSRLGRNFSVEGSPEDATAPTAPNGYINTHGTSVSGTAAATADNGQGLIGVAHGAEVIPIRLFQGNSPDADYAFSVTDLQIAESLAYLAASDTPPADRVDVSNNSWAPRYDTFTARKDAIGPLTSLALEHGVTQGRGGRGIVYCFAAGNNDNVWNPQTNSYMAIRARTTYNGFASDRRVICVGGSDSRGLKTYYSEPGCSLLVNAPTGYDLGFPTSFMQPGLAGLLVSISIYPYHDIVPYPGYGMAGGTSSATPQAAGTVALMLQANPNLTYRDVQHILVDTATVTNPNTGAVTNPDQQWLMNGSGRLYSHQLGFGRIDAAAAVARARTWINVPAEERFETRFAPRNPPVIQDPGPGPSYRITSGTVTLAAPSFFVEHVEVDLTLAFPRRGDLQIVLLSPSGMYSIFQTPNQDATPNYSGFTFTSVAHWGEQASGPWTLYVVDAVDDGSPPGRLLGYTLRAWGHRR